MPASKLSLPGVTVRVKASSELEGGDRLNNGTLMTLG